MSRSRNLLHQDGQLSRVPHVPAPQVDNTRKGFFTSQDLERMLNHLLEHAQQVVRFAYLTGWRKSEILEL